jgi:hypothetical protein
LDTYLAVNHRKTGIVVSPLFQLWRQQLELRIAAADHAASGCTGHKRTYQSMRLRKNPKEEISFP